MPSVAPSISVMRASATRLLQIALFLLAPNVVAQSATGTLDASFGTGGKAITDIRPGNYDAANAVAIQPDGKILSAGFWSGEWVPPWYPAYVTRHDAAGNLDPSFGNGGVATVYFSLDCSLDGCYSIPSTMALQADGRILLPGTLKYNYWGGTGSGAGTGYSFVLARLDANGENAEHVLTTFSDDSSQDAAASEVLIQPDGKIVAVGRVGQFSLAGSPQAPTIVRYNPDLTLDATFGDGGKVVASVVSGSPIAARLEPDGKIAMVVGGSSGLSLVRYAADGSFDTMVTNAAPIEDATLHYSVFNAALFQPDGKIVASAYSCLLRTPSSTSGSYCIGVSSLMRFDSTLTPDPLFASGGRYSVLGISMGGLELQPDGKIIALSIPSPYSAGSDILRFTADGTPDDSFGIGGRVAFWMGPDGKAQSDTLQADGRIVLAGGANLDNSDVDFALARIDPQAPLALTPAPIALDFGTRTLSTTSPSQSVVVTNTSGAPVTVYSVVVSEPWLPPPFQPAFQAIHDCTALEPGGSCTIDVTFHPLFEGAERADLLLVTSADFAKMVLTGVGERSMVSQYYESILGRAPDASGRTYWEGEASRLAALGADPNEVWFIMARYFFDSPEYQSYNKTDEQFVTDLYRAFFDREPDAGGLSYWTGQIAAGMPRDVVLLSFLFSPEFRAFMEGIFGNTAARPEVNLVMDLYRGILARLPETDAFNYWVGQLRTAQCLGTDAVYAKVDELSYGFIFGQEYRDRARDNAQYVSDLYDAFLRRGGDLSGINFWRAQLEIGAMDRNAARAAFIATPEFGARVNAVAGAGCIQ